MFDLAAAVVAIAFDVAVVVGVYVMVVIGTVVVVVVVVVVVDAVVIPSLSSFWLIIWFNFFRCRCRRRRAATSSTTDRPTDTPGNYPLRFQPSLGPYLIARYCHRCAHTVKCSVRQEY